MAAPHVSGVAALCIASGECAGSPTNIIAELRGDAAARPPSYGFTGDPNNPMTSDGPNAETFYYGHLTHAGGY